MKITRRQLAGGSLRPPMTAMIDVVFLLLIYFVCTASFTPPEATLAPLVLEAEGQSAESSDDTPKERLEIEVPPAPAPLVVDGTPYRSLGELAQRLAAETSRERQRQVVLDVDRQTEFGRAIDVYDQCQLAGIRQILFAVRVD